ncbi:MAG: TolC family protein, partial [Cyclobacteriaceae bacterium]|nr:TolC family protein [Cyclobacteriaceae bacterium]
QYNPNGGFFDFSQAVPDIQPGDVAAAQNFFQLKSGGDARLSVSQLIFNGSYFVGLQAANAYKDLAQKKALRTDEEITLNVARAYYNVLINQARTELFTANIARVDSLLRITLEMNKNGFAEGIDVDRLQVARNNLNAERDNFLMVNELSFRLLKYQMNFPMDEPLELSGTLMEMLAMDEDDNPQHWDYSLRPDYQVMEASYNMQKLNVKNLYAEGMPVIAGFANMGYSTQSPDFGGLFRTNSTFTETAGIGRDGWYGYSLFGISFNWSLFTGLSRNYKIQQEKLSLVKMENGFDALRKSIDLEIWNAHANLVNARQRLAVQSENMELARKIVQVSRKKYEAGIGSNLEIIEAENELKASQNNYYNAMYDAILAKLDQQKALGKIITN